MKKPSVHSLPLQAGKPDGTRLLRQGPYYWLNPTKGTPLVRVDNLGNEAPVTQRQIIFVEDFLPGKTRLFLAGQDITSELRATAEALRGGGEAPQAYMLLTTHLKRLAVEFIIWHRKPLCTNLFLKARKGTMTAIMGGSGCGKSVFIKMLAGCNRPSSGTILVNGRPLSEMMGLVGYVPQGDVLLPELTGRNSLDYTLKLFAPYLTKEERAAAISHVAKALELPESVLDMQIGRLEWQGRYPSGGQRRRISLAHELIRWPEILILDEPTSGLSAADAENVINLLRQQVDLRGMTIVTSIHAPNALMFSRFDDLLLVGQGGKICYYGPRKDALMEVTQNLFGTPDDLMNAMANPKQVEALVTNYNYCEKTHCPSVQYFTEEAK